MIDGMIKDAEDFAIEFTEKLSNPNTTTASKQVYFMDNHKRIQNTMMTLNKIVSHINTAANSSDENIASENETQLTKAKQILSTLKIAISDFQKLLTIDENVKEEDLPYVSLTSQSIMETMQNNKKENESDKPKLYSNNNVFYTHVFITDGIMHYFYAETKEDVDNAISKIVSDHDFKEVSLYALSPIKIPLKKKTIFTM